jgi:hypothetical protein
MRLYLRARIHFREEVKSHKRNTTFACKTHINHGEKKILGEIKNVM